MDTVLARGGGGLVARHILDIPLFPFYVLPDLIGFLGGMAMTESHQLDFPNRRIRRGSLVTWTVVGLVGVGLLGFSLYALARSPSWHVRFAVEASRPAAPQGFNYRDFLPSLSLSALLPLVLLVIAAYFVITQSASRRREKRRVEAERRVEPGRKAELDWRIPVPSPGPAPCPVHEPAPSSMSRRIPRPLLWTLCGLGTLAGLALLAWLFILKGQPSSPPMATLPPSLPPPGLANPYSLRVTPDGPPKIHSNEQVPIWITVSLEKAPAGSDPLFLDGTQPYLVAGSIQPGAFDVSSEYLKPRKDQLKVGTPVKWLWIVAPKLDRLGEQKIAFDTEVYDPTGKTKYGSRFLIATIEVNNPLGLPMWLVYLGSVLGLLGLSSFGSFIATEISNRLKERREHARKQAATDRKEPAVDQGPQKTQAPAGGNKTAHKKKGHRS